MLNSLKDKQEFLCLLLETANMRVSGSEHDFLFLIDLADQLQHQPDFRRPVTLRLLMMIGETGRSWSSGQYVTSWLNSLRLDLVALGLERRERPMLNLATYLAKSAPAETEADAA